MDPDRVFRTLADHQVDYLLIGGMNFFLRHRPVSTFDIDIWILDQPANRRRCERALADVGAEWGPDDASWAPVAGRPPGWLDQQMVFCLLTDAGPVDVFRCVEGLGDWETSAAAAVEIRRPGGVNCPALSDRDLIRCQEALPEALRRGERLNYLRGLLNDREDGNGS